MVNTISATTASQATSATTSTDRASEVSSDFETFLQMLTVQMQNQDPLNPVESADFAVQLATFSEVEQAVLTNDLLEDLSTQLGLMGFSELSGWVGKEARSEASGYFNGETPVSLSGEFASAADSATLIVRDASGNVVEQVAINTDAQDFEWPASGSGSFDAGAYSFEIENYYGDTYLSSTSVESYTRIVEARADNGDTVLVLEGGTEIASEDVTALRDGG
ncbi:flagellar hook capping FlgD N-terminal domain-containing protein [Celeribacter litoreus]|uniref:flagellar hook capping FlgD N-terminal domain-containing protein n=1 Tax=Celeribacter litoreus TaxID=2876714 RepID=UPI001CCF33A4|nr:flagellar hook capping FlgD N-terminal domain-containing protein [Celeribacter litoreus]MCA0044251.1 flagellar hook assembly protein FlgD [Celeribacter litoreus]